MTIGELKEKLQEYNVADDYEIMVGFELAFSYAEDFAVNHNDKTVLIGD